MNACRCWIGVSMLPPAFTLYFFGTRERERERERERSGDADPWQVQNSEEQEGNAVLPGGCICFARVQFTLSTLQTVPQLCCTEDCSVKMKW